MDICLVVSGIGLLPGEKGNVFVGFWRCIIFVIIVFQLLVIKLIYMFFASISLNSLQFSNLNQFSIYLSSLLHFKT